jgi:ribosome-associated heat shock protein Hsp15
MELKEVRVDKYLTAIRIYKTRTIATEAIDAIKSSRKVKIGEAYVVKRENQTLEIEVIKLIDKRVSAPLAQECYRVIRDVIHTIHHQNSSIFHPNIYREKGAGRPTKRERREIDGFTDEDF